MKAEERHKLKENELDSLLKDVPGALRNFFFGSQISKIITSLLVIMLLFYSLKSIITTAQDSARQKQASELASLMTEISNLKVEAIKGAESAEVDKYLTSSKSLVTSFAKLADSSKSDGFEITAMLNHAKSLRSQLLYSGTQIETDQRDNILEQISAIYTKLQSKYKSNAIAQGAAKLGLAVIAEDRADYAQAKKLYQEIIDAGTDKLVGTPYALQAKLRLAKIDESSSPLDFKWVEPVAEAVPVTPDTNTSAVDQPADSDTPVDLSSFEFVEPAEESN